MKLGIVLPYSSADMSLPIDRVLEAERSALLRLRDRGAINDEVRRRIERELDLQDAWLEA